MRSPENPRDECGTTVLVDVLGCTVAVRFPVGSGSVDSFRGLWSRALVVDDRPPDAVVDVVDDGPDDEVQHALSSQVTLAAIEVRSRDLWMIHAAGLGDPATGRAVALVAPSGTGKSTAAAHLGRRWAYLSDETVGVDRAGQVVIHPKPLSRVVPGTTVKRQVGPDEAGLLDTDLPLKLAAVVLLDRDGSPSPVVEPVRRTHALARIAAQTSFLARLPRPLHYVNDVLDSTAGVWSVRYGEVETLEPVIADLLAKPPAPAPVVEVRGAPATAAPVVDVRGAPATSLETPAAPAPRPAPRIRALPVLDVLDVDHERLVLIDDRVILLSPVASVVHRLLPPDDPIEIPDLLDRIGAEIALPPEPEQALVGLLGQLAADAMVAFRE